MSQMPQDATARPAAVTDKHLEYLDDVLRGDPLAPEAERPMLGALLMHRFGVTRVEALTILEYWMRTFVARHGRRTP